MKVQLLRKSEIFTQYLDEPRFSGLVTGMFITFLAKVDNDLEPEIKQFYCFAKNYERKCSFCFNNLLFAKEGDMLEILPYRSDDGNNRGLGTLVIDVRNISRPEFNVNSATQEYKDNWDNL